MHSFKRSLLPSIIHWIPLAVLTVLLCGTLFAAIQSDLRSGADDPQIQMATDARDSLQVGASAQSLVPTTQIDIAQSLAPYLVIYDASGQPVASGATLHGQALTPPSGVFDYARTHSMDRLTWMPEAGVRSAIIVVHYNDGYVLAGRSLRQVEQREDEALLTIGALGVFTLAMTFLATLVSQTVATRLASSRVS